MKYVQRSKIPAAKLYLLQNFPYMWAQKRQQQLPVVLQFTCSASGYGLKSLDAACLYLACFMLLQLSLTCTLVRCTIYMHRNISSTSYRKYQINSENLWWHIIFFQVDLYAWTNKYRYLLTIFSGYPKSCIKKNQLLRIFILPLAVYSSNLK